MAGSSGGGGGCGSDVETARARPSLGRSNPRPCNRSRDEALQRLGHVASVRATQDEDQRRRVVAVLDAMVTPALADEPALLASWKTIKRVRKSGGGGMSANVPTPSAPTAAAGTVA